MPLFRKLTDEEEITRIENNTKAWLAKNYDLFPNQNGYPEKAYLLKPTSLLANSYDTLPDGLVRINIGYSSHFSLFINDHQRIGYDRIIKGTLLCASLKEIKELPYSKTSEIKIGYFSKFKEITFPVQKTKSVFVKCMKIFIEDIDTFVRDENTLIPEADFLEDMYKRFN